MILTSATAAITVALFILMEVLMAIVRDYMTFRARKAQRRIDQLIRQAIADGVTTTDGLMNSEYMSDLFPKEGRIWKRVRTMPPGPSWGPWAIMVRRQEKRMEGWRGLVLQRVQRLLADESASRKQAEAEIIQYLPGIPRSAKRLFNHLRILLVIAERKRMFGGMFGGQPELDAKHLGKWAVLLRALAGVRSSTHLQSGPIS
jgi:hypothetical protein